MFRCPQCRTRRKDYGLFTQHLRASGHGLCNCGGYHFAHRPGSPLCEQNPRSVWNDAIRQGASLDDLIEIILYVPGEIGGSEPPF